MLLDGTIINVLNIAKSGGILHIIGKRCLKIKELFKIGDYSSCSLGIHIVNEMNVIEDWPCHKINCKIFKVPCTNGFITNPIIHTFGCFS